MKKFYRLYGIASCIRRIPLRTALPLLFITLITITGHAQVNAYAKVTVITTVSGKSRLTITNINQTYDTFAVGKEVVIIQMQDNVINGTRNNSSFGLLSSIANAGLYEVATISALTSTTMTLTSTLGNSYTTSGNNSSVQVVSFTKLLTAGSTNNYTTTGNITAVPWNGSLGTGGVIAFQVPGTLTLRHSVIADGQGFAGGAASGNYEDECEPDVYRTSSTNYGAKGEGIYLINTSSNDNYLRGRARILTGGGGGSDDNGGGAGGSNYSAGGDGGPGWTCSGTDASGGMGGIALGTYLSTGTRVFMGGGGGGGQGNNGTQTAGANGGGIILIKAGVLTTDCTSSVRISANGNNAGNTTGSGNDGAGGAGAAGTIVMQINSYSVPSSCSLAIQANGGNGGSVMNTNSHGGGGGGGQGALLFTGALPSGNITPVTAPGAGGLNSSASGATRANNGGGSNNSGIIVGIGTVLPVRLIYFAAENKNSRAVLNWTSADESNVTYNVQHSTDGVSFTTIGTVKGTGNSNTTTNYTFTDPNVASGRNYYRLEMTGNLPARTGYSSVVSINLSGLWNIPVAYPNPAHDHFYIRVNSENSNKNHMVIITDLTGKVIYTTTGKPANSIIAVVPGKPLKPGLYMFKITCEGSDQTGKVIVQ